MNKHIRKLSLSFTLAAIGGCASCQQEFGEAANKAVVVEYDHQMSFRSYRFNDYVRTSDGAGGGITLYFPTDARKTGFWAVFVICSIENLSPGAETFQYDVRRWYVEHEGRRWYYDRALPRDRYGVYSLGGLGGPGAKISFGPYGISGAAHRAFSDQFRSEVVRGPDSQQFPKDLYPALAYRIAIFVESEKGYQPDRPEGNLRLEYEGFPVLTEKRTDSVAVLDSGVEVSAGGLQSTCRAPD